MKRVCIRSFPGPYFPAFELNRERYGVFLRIQSECGKIGTLFTKCGKRHSYMSRASQLFSCLTAFSKGTV